MLTTAVVSILVVQNSLLCDRKLQELKKAKFSIFPAANSPEISNSLNTFFMRAKRVQKLILNLVHLLSFILVTMVLILFLFLLLLTIYIMEIVTKNKLWHCSFGIWTNKTKHTKDCMRTEFIWIFLWKGARYIHCHLTWPWHWISNMATLVLLWHISYKTTPISWNSTGNILMIYD